MHRCDDQKPHRCRGIHETVEDGVSAGEYPAQSRECVDASPMVPCSWSDCSPHLKRGCSWCLRRKSSAHTIGKDGREITNSSGPPPLPHDFCPRFADRSSNRDWELFTRAHAPAASQHPSANCATREIKGDQKRNIGTATVAPTSTAANLTGVAMFLEASPMWLLAVWFFGMRGRRTDGWGVTHQTNQALRLITPRDISRGQGISMA